MNYLPPKCAHRMSATAGNYLFGKGLKDNMEINCHGIKTMLLPAPPEEQIYSYSTLDDSPQEESCIGHLCGEFGPYGEDFLTDWTDHTTKLKSPAFTAEFDPIVNELRSCGLLKNCYSMSKQIYRWPQALIPGTYGRFVLFLETEKHLYYLRCNPDKCDHNFYLYAYNRDLLMEVQRQAKGLPKSCFSYDENTRKPVLTIYGEQGFHSAFNLLTDDFVEYWHTHKIGGTLREFMGMSLTDYQNWLQNGESSGIFTCNPHKKFIAVHKAIVDIKNESLSVSKAQAAAMKAGAVFGWHTPLANPKRYNEQGIYKEGEKANERNEQFR